MLYFTWLYKYGEILSNKFRVYLESEYIIKPNDNKDIKKGLNEINYE